MPRRIDGAVVGLEKLERGFDVAERHRPAARDLVHRPPEHETPERRRRAPVNRPTLEQRDRASSSLEKRLPSPFSNSPAADSSHAHVSRASSASSASTSTMRRVESIHEQRQELGADSIARDRDVLIGLVVTYATLALVQIRAQFHPAAVEERADDRAVPRIHRRQAARAGAAQQPSRNVSAWSSRVWPSATTSASNCRRARSKNSYRASRAASSIDRRSRTRARRDVLAVRGERHVQRARHGGRKLLVALRARPEADG